MNNDKIMTKGGLRQEKARISGKMSQESSCRVQMVINCKYFPFLVFHDCAWLFASKANLIHSKSRTSLFQLRNMSEAKKKLNKLFRFCQLVVMWFSHQTAVVWGGCVSYCVSVLALNVTPCRRMYLKWPQNQIEHHPHGRVDVVRNESKNDVVYPKERNEQQCGFGQSPEAEHAKRRFVPESQCCDWELSLFINPT